MRRIVLVCLFSLMATLGVNAEITLSGIFSENMVVQRDVPIPLKGTATPNTTIIVSFGDQKMATKSDAKGNWHVTLGPSSASRYPKALKVSDKITSVAIAHIYVGDIWVLVGDEALLVSMNEANNTKDEIKTGRNPQLFMYQVQPTVSQFREAKVYGTWEPATQKTIGKFSALGYFIGKELVADYNIPVGIIVVAYPNSPIEGFISLETLLQPKNRTKFLIMHAKWRRNFIEYKKNLVVYPQRLKEWEANGRKGEKPRPPKGVNDYRRPGNLYNAMLSGIGIFPVKGLLLDQTKGNLESSEYIEFVKTFISDLSNKWGVKTLPMVIIQATNDGEEQLYPVEAKNDILPRFREKQAILAKEKNIGIVVTTDLKEKKDELAVKTNAEKLASRAVRVIKKIAYGDKTIVASGPTVKTITFKGSKVVITFDNVGPGLIIKNNSKIRGFAIAGKDKKFYWARGTILNKNTIVLQRRDKVLKPVAVRYNWANNPIGNLYNKEALPVAPFRTDKWDDVKGY